MKTAPELLVELNELDEHVAIEAKTAADMDRSLLETVCAFANEPRLGGGAILLGVAPAEDGLWPTYEVVGLDDPDRMQAEIATQCTTAFNVPIRPRIAVERLDGKVVLVVSVAEAAPHDKPVYFRNQPLPRAAMRRIGSTDQHCKDDLIVFYQDRRGETYDMQVVADAELSALDPDVIEHYRRLRADVNPEAEELGWPDEELLEALGATRRHNGSTRPTVAGILLFGTKKALRTYFPMMRIDYIRVPGVQWVKDPDRRFETIEIRSPLIRAVARARAAILDDLPRAFSLPSGAIQGQDIPLSIQIIRYANRLEIRNPGYSLKADDRLGEPGSETRNPKIAAVFHDIKYAETKGSGIRVMRELMAEHNLSPPVLQSDRTNNSFLALLLFHHFLNELDLEWLASFGEDGLTEDECKALVSAREVGAIDNASYRDINRGADTLAASKHLRRLCGFGLIEKRGQGSATYYVPTKKLLQGWYEIQSRESGAQSGEFPAQSGEFPAQSGEFPAQSGELPAQSGKLSGVQKSTRRSALTGLPRELAEEIRGLKARARGETLQAIVLKLCSHKDLSVAALARILRRHPDYLQERVVAPLVRMGRLEFTIPSEPTHPRQTYRTRKET